MRFIVLAAVLLLATSATAQTLHNNPAANIFDTYDPRCNGSDPSIVFCDGFEDGTYIVDEGVRGGPQSDYWSRGVFYQPFPDRFGRNFAECNASPDPNRADFGAAGTRCTATMDWAVNGNHGQDASHWFMAQPGNPAQPRPVGTWNYYIRFYFKEAGTTSTRCSTGWPNCPAFVQAGPNGYKAVEVNHGNETGGIDGAVLGTVFANGSGRATLSAGGACLGGGFDGQQNLGNTFDHRLHRDEWIYTELHVSETSNGTMEIWMDSCGRDGRQCTGTPTLRARYTGVNLANTCGPASTGQKIRALWSNWWNTSLTGEIQFDEFVVRNGEVTNAPIGFLTTLTGGNPPPPPPPPTPLAPPVLLPIN
jgi:hypothetical protein